MAGSDAEMGDAGRVLDGQFGKMMDVALVNDGPVTIVVDSRCDSTQARE